MDNFIKYKDLVTKINSKKVRINDVYTTEKGIYKVNIHYRLELLQNFKTANISGTNSGDETNSTIQSKRPLKTIEGQSLEGEGNINLTSADIEDSSTKCFNIAMSIVL